MASKEDLAVEAMPPPSYEDFIENFVLEERPILLRGLHRGTPLEPLIGDRTAVTNSLGERPYRLSQHISSGLLQKPEPLHCNLRSYIEAAETLENGQGLSEELAPLADENGRFRMHLREFDSPPELEELVERPDYLNFNGDLGTVTSRFFFGGAGTNSGLHFDWDHKHVLFTQLLGSKSCVLVPPSAGALLRSHENLSGIQFWLLPEETQRHLLLAWGAKKVILEAGDTLYIPRLYWHHLETKELGVSFNLRFGSNPYSQLLSALPPLFTLQNLSLSTTDRDQRTLRNPEILDTLMHAFLRTGNDAELAYKRLRRAGRELYETYCPDAMPYRLFEGAFELEEHSTKGVGLQWKLQQSKIWAACNSETPDLYLASLASRLGGLGLEQQKGAPYLKEHPLAMLLAARGREKHG